MVAHKTYLGVRDDLPARPDVGGMEIEDDVDEEDDVDNGVDDEEAARDTWNTDHLHQLVSHMYTCASSHIAALEFLSSFNSVIEINLY